MRQDVGAQRVWYSGVGTGGGTGASAPPPIKLWAAAPTTRNSLVVCARHGARNKSHVQTAGIFFQESRA